MEYTHVVQFLKSLVAPQGKKGARPDMKGRRLRRKHHLIDTHIFAKFVLIWWWEIVPVQKLTHPSFENVDDNKCVFCFIVFFFVYLLFSEDMWVKTWRGTPYP